MTQWSMVADLRRCVGCQTCTAACKHANATSPAVQWRRVLDFETGTFPNVGRTFMPVGCMHCSDPPCMHVCPSTATGQRNDGLVTIDYDLCIGCAYCAVACPYQARYKVDKPFAAYAGSGPMSHEAAREDPARLGVAQKCTFCSDKIDFGLANGLTPGIAPEATPACVNSCIADALHFGDRDDPASNVSTLLAENATFRMHGDLGTEPNFHYIWATKAQEGQVSTEEMAVPDLPARGVGGVGAAAPWLQQHWDWRAAGNFVFGGTGSGLMIAAAVMGLTGQGVGVWPLIALGFVGAGLFLVFLETGRPLRAPLNVFFHPQRSWMTREAMAGAVLFAAGMGAWVSGSTLLLAMAGVIAAVYLYCQARILTEAKGIPAWRNPTSLPLMISTGLVEGLGVYLLVAPFRGQPENTLRAAVLVLLVLLVLRAWAWRHYVAVMATAAPAAANTALDAVHGPFQYAGNYFAAFLGAVILVFPNLDGPMTATGVIAVVGGWLFKYTLITQASYNQGFELLRTPEKGGGSGPGGRPGWETGP